MRVSILIFVCGVVAGATIVRSQPPGTRVEESTRTIPLESCYATFSGTGLRRLSENLGEPHEIFLNQLVHGGRCGSSNVALVRAKDIKWAVRASSIAFCGGMLLDTPVLPDQEPSSKSEPVWLAANLGVSALGMRKVHSVEVMRRTIRLSFSKPKPAMIGDLAQLYVLWAPLGQLPTATYHVELFDVDRNQVMLLRRVEVKVP